VLREHITCSSIKTLIRPNPFLLPYVHPQTDHATFWPTPYVHQIFCPLWQFSTVTLWPCDIFLLWHSDSVTIFYCDTLTMWHFYTVTFWLCDNFLLWHFNHVTFFYCDILPLWHFSTVTFHLKVDGLSVHPKKLQFCHTVTFRFDLLQFWPAHGSDIFSTSDFDFARRYLV
jgi:hypothetical protein